MERFHFAHRARLLIVALLVFAGGASVLRAQSEEAGTPERAVRDFYLWYVGELVAERDPFTDGRAQLQRFASDRLLREIDKARKSEDGLGSDPFLDAQDFDKEWAKNITVTDPKVSGQKATANVELSGPEMGKQKLKVALVRENDRWKIDKVEGQ